jgi:GxxExxY protein
MERDLTEKIIGAAIEVHRSLGPGLLESIYEECMAIELHLRGIEFVRQKALPIEYKGRRVAADLKIDLLIENQVVVELKAIECLLPVHAAQLLTYMKLSNLPLGLLINFHVPLLKDGIKRMVL